MGKSWSVSRTPMRVLTVVRSRSRAVSSYIRRITGHSTSRGNHWGSRRSLQDKQEDAVTTSGVSEITIFAWEVCTNTYNGSVLLKPTWLRGRPTTETSHPCQCSWRLSWWHWHSDRVTDMSSPGVLQSPEGLPSGQQTPCRPQLSLQIKARTSQFVRKDNFGKRKCQVIY